MSDSRSHTGLLVALLVIFSWLSSIIFLMSTEASLSHPLTWIFIFVQMHLYTGLFITAHDAMHRTVSPDIRVNNLVGQICTFLYAMFPYRRLYTKHHEHHRHVHTDQDPDFYQGNFVQWYAKFIGEYLSIWQLVGMAALFNVLAIWIPQKNLILYWVVPSLLSTIQLFYFGTWLPHHGDHSNHHHSRSQRKGHLLAFFSCYFFGYHYEHHDSPGTPWWRLWKLKSDGN